MSYEERSKCKMLENANIIIAPTLQQATVWLHKVDAAMAGQVLVTLEEFFDNWYKLDLRDTWVWMTGAGVYFNEVLFKSNALYSYMPFEDEGTVHDKEPKRRSIIEQALLEVKIDGIWWSINRDDRDSMNKPEYHIPAQYFAIWNSLDPRIQRLVYREAQRKAEDYK